MQSLHLIYNCNQFEHFTLIILVAAPLQWCSEFGYRGSEHYPYNYTTDCYKIKLYEKYEVIKWIVAGIAGDLFFSSLAKGCSHTEVFFQPQNFSSLGLAVVSEVKQTSNRQTNSLTSYCCREWIEMNNILLLSSWFSNQSDVLYISTNKRMFIRQSVRLFVCLLVP